MRKLLAALAVGTLPLSAAARDDKADEKAIQGTWVATELTENGKARGEDAAKKVRVVLADGKITVTIGDGEDRGGTYRIDPSKDPKHFDIVASSGENAGKTREGICELKGDTLRLRIAPVGAGRPKEFKIEEGAKGVLLVLKREGK